MAVKLKLCFSILFFVIASVSCQPDYYDYYDDYYDDYDQDDVTLQAVCRIQPSSTRDRARGTINLEEVPGTGRVTISGTLTGLSPGLHALAIHSNSAGRPINCNRIGGHFNPLVSRHGSRTSAVRHLGDLGNIRANVNGRATFNFQIAGVSLNPNLRRSIIGRAMAVHIREDDLGLGGNQQSRIDGNAGRSVGCGTITRTNRNARAVLRQPARRVVRQPARRVVRQPVIRRNVVADYVDNDILGDLDDDYDV